MIRKNTCHYTIETPIHASGAIGIVRLTSTDASTFDASLAHLGLAPVRVGQVRRMSILDIDDGIVARWDDCCADLMVHGGRGVIEAVTHELTNRGVKRACDSGESLRNRWPEAASDIEAQVLEALAHAASPRAVPILLAQPTRHAADLSRGVADANALGHLLTPPFVLILGPPNVGKSSLLNALVGQEASIVADRPGTTRDTVAAMAVLDGLTVRLADAPGMAAEEPDEIVAAAAEIARTLEGAADLVVLCGDSQSPPLSTDRPSITVATRSDLDSADWPHDHAVSMKDAARVRTLAIAIRRALVPDAALNDERPWSLT